MNTRWFACAALIAAYAATPGAQAGSPNSASFGRIAAPSPNSRSFGRVTAASPTTMSCGRITAPSPNGMSFGRSMASSPIGMSFGRITSASPNGMSFGRATASSPIGMSFGRITATSPNGLSYGRAVATSPNMMSYGGIAGLSPAMSTESLGSPFATATSPKLAVTSVMADAQAAYSSVAPEATARGAKVDRNTAESRDQKARSGDAIRKPNSSRRTVKESSDRSNRGAGTTARQGVPAKQPPRLVDPQTGKIAWPSTLRDDGFRESREAVESVLARCTAGAGAVERGELAQAAGSLLEQLKSRVEEATPSEYVAARQFLKTLALEAKSPAGLK